MKKISRPVAQIKESIFATMTQLAIENNAINLSQGFPDFDGPKWILNIAKETMDQNYNQYAPFPGTIGLRESISKNFMNYYNLSYDPQKEITVTNGATEGIFSTVMALLNPGDEVIVFEPYYDSYIASIEIAGGVPVPVTLNAPDFKWNIEELEKAFSSKTKLVIFNTPHNPTGKVFDRDEMEILADLVKKYDAYIISDEVYEHLTFDNLTHLPMAKLKGMKERTITISSTGKTFSLTGWKIGWVASSPKISHAIRMVHQFNTFSVAHPFQKTMEIALLKLKGYLPEFKKVYEFKRNFFCNGLINGGYNPYIPGGTFFVMCPIESHSTLQDVDYCMELIKTKKVASIPTSAFYLNSEDGKKYIRFCFAKKDETLKAALQNLSTLKYDPR